MESKEAIADIQAHRAGESFKLEAIVTNKINPSRPSIAALSSKRYLLAWGFSSFFLSFFFFFLLGSDLM